jgi:hypothetical protein
MNQPNTPFFKRLRDAGCLLFCVFTLLSATQVGCSKDNDTTGDATAENQGVDLEKCVLFEVLDGVSTTPSNIMLFFGLQNCKGEPILGLEAEDFTVKESGNPISQYESNLRVLPRCTGFDLVSVLLLDMSGSVIESGQLPVIQSASRAFIEQLASDYQLVSIYLFDGRPDLEPLIDFTSDKEKLFEAIDSLTDYEVIDNSTNLNGAVVDGLDVLDAYFSNSIALQQEGSLVVFTDGTDQAQIVDNPSVAQAVTESTHKVYSIGLGGETDETHLLALGKTGAVFPEKSEEVVGAFNQIGEQILVASQRFYVIGYCSPKRNGEHTLTLQVGDYKGALQAVFNAGEFGPGCDAEVIAEKAQLNAKACADTTVFSGTGQFIE